MSPASSEVSRPLDIVYLGRWWGFKDYQVALVLMRLLADGGGGEVIATEAPSPAADHTLRWLSHWAESFKGRVSLSVLRDPPPGSLIAGVDPSPASGAEVLVATGWVGPLTLAQADRVSEDRRQSGSDALAGLRWGLVGGSGLDSGAIAVGDASLIVDAQSLEWWTLSDGDFVDLRPKDVPLLVVRVGGDFPYDIEVYPTAQPAAATKLSSSGRPVRSPDAGRRLRVTVHPQRQRAGGATKQALQAGDLVQTTLARLGFTAEAQLHWYAEGTMPPLKWLVRGHKGLTDTSTDVPSILHNPLRLPLNNLADEASLGRQLHRGTRASAPSRSDLGGRGTLRGYRDL
jgi:hypothetical protein